VWPGTRSVSGGRRRRTPEMLVRVNDGGCGPVSSGREAAAVNRASSVA
jgi:hypothetical protein